MSLSLKLRFEVFKRDNFTCRYCGRKTPEAILEADHVIPVCEGGDNDLSNLVTSCFECNRGKGKILLDVQSPEFDIHEKTILLAEREMQLREYKEVCRQIKEREDREINIIEEEFSKHVYTTKHFPNAAVRAALKVMSYIDILECFTMAHEKIKRDGAQSGWAYSVSAYFAGILWNKVKDK